VGIRKHHGAFRNHRLAQHTLAQSDAPPSEPFTNRLGDCLVHFQAATEQFRGDLTCHIIARRSKAASHQKNVATWKSIEQGVADPGPIWDGGLSPNSQADLEKLLTEISEVGICHRAEEQLGASVQEFHIHRELGLVGLWEAALLRPSATTGAASGCRAKNLSLTRQRLDPGVEAGVFLKVLSQVVNVKKIGQHPKQDLPWCRGFEVRITELKILTSENFLAVRSR
jgi:hypothetical protein